MDRNAPMTIPPEPPHDVACSQGKNRCSAIVWQIFRERYPKQVLYFVKVNTKGKLETRTKGNVDKCSDLTFTKKYALVNINWVRTKHGTGVHGHPLWTGSMDHFHGPGPWTPCHRPGPWTFFYLYKKVLYQVHGHSKNI